MIELLMLREAMASTRMEHQRGCACDLCTMKPVDYVTKHAAELFAQKTRRTRKAAKGVRRGK